MRLEKREVQWNSAELCAQRLNREIDKCNYCFDDNNFLGLMKSLINVYKEVIPYAKGKEFENLKSLRDKIRVMNNKLCSHRDKRANNRFIEVFMPILEQFDIALRTSAQAHG